MARTTISIPDDLKKRMDKVSEPVNWSQVAASAFEAKLGDIASRKEKKNMQDVIQRLRASKLQGQTRLAKEAFESGVEWAKSGAEWSEIEGIVEYANHHEAWVGVPDHWGWPGVLLAAATGEREFDRGDYDLFVEDIGPVHDDIEWAQGFCSGVASVYESVKDQV
jgi:hypothetical protein